MTPDTEEPGRWASLREAADVLGLNEKSVRRRIRAGTLRAKQVASPYGPAWQVWLGAIAPEPSTLNGHDGEPGRQDPPTLHGAPREDGPPATPQHESGSLLEVLRMLDERDRTIMELSGRAGYFQAQLEQARETIRALEAPRPAEVDPDTTTGVGAVYEPTTRPWWRRMLGLWRTPPVRRRLRLWAFLFVGAGVAFTLAGGNRATATWLLVSGLAFAVAALLLERR